MFSGTEMSSKLLSPAKLQELSFGWSVNYVERQQLSVRTHSVLAAVGLSHIPLETPLQVQCSFA